MSEFSTRIDRLNESQRKALLARLDDVDPPSNSSNRRAMPRLPFRRTHVAVTITQPGGGSIVCTVPTRDLSSGGLSFIYWGFLHKNTHVQCVLSRRRGSADLVESNVTWCKLLGGANHLIGVRFRTPIQPELYLELQDGPVRHKAFDPRNLGGRVLVVTSSELERHLITHYFKQTAIEFVCVESTELAVQVCARQTFDLLLCDLDFQEGEAERAIVAMRMGGFSGTLLSMTAESGVDYHRKAREAGAAATIRKPLVEDAFLREIARWLNTGRTSEDGPMYSELSGRGLDPLIGAFVSQTRVTSQRLRELLASEDLSAIRRECNAIRGYGTSYGFPAATDAAATVIDVIDQTGSVVDVMSPVVRLCQTLSRLAMPALAA